MSHTFESVIQQLQGKNGAEPVIEALKAKQATMPADASDEQVTAAIREVLSDFIERPQEERPTPAPAPAPAAAPAPAPAPAPVSAPVPAPATVPSNVYGDAIEKVRGKFQEKGWKYSERSLRDDVTIFEISFGLDNCSVRMKVYVETDPDVCRIDGILPITADETYAYPLCKHLIKTNYSLRYGAFHYDESDGEVSFQYSFPIMNGLDLDVFYKMFLIVANTVDDKYPDIRKYCVGRFNSKDRDEILKMIENLVKDLDDDE